MYPFLRTGDRIPSVAAVQILINRKMSQGTYIGVDGIYGRNTREAVRTFQRSKRLAPDGKVGKNTWAALISGENIQVIDSVDLTNHKDMGYEDAAIRAAGGNPIVNFGMCNGIKVVTQKIQQHASTGAVALLRFHGHGSPGEMGVTTGTGSELSSEFGVTFLDSLARHLQQLAPIFSPFGSAERTMTLP